MYVMKMYVHKIIFDESYNNNNEMKLKFLFLFQLRTCAIIDEQFLQTTFIPTTKIW